MCLLLSLIFDLSLVILTSCLADMSLRESLHFVNISIYRQEVILGLPAAISTVNENCFFFKPQLSQYDKSCYSWTF